VIYKNSWVTNKTVSQDNVVLIVNCARARWKIENEHNNVLKNQGYNLKHNFGHGENHASENYCLLNILAFLFHGILMLSDENYQKARATVGRRTEFFSELRAALKFVRHNDWDGFLLFVRVIQGPG